MGTSRTLRTIRGVDVRGKRVLLRIDGNVAVDAEGRPFSGGEQRLQAIVPTIAYLRTGGARLVLLTHLGRPAGRVVERLRLDDVAQRLTLLLKHPVRYVPDIRGARARAAVRELRDGDVLLLENLRFDPGEEFCDPTFAAELAALGDIVVNDAFGDSHRRHASVALLPTLHPAYAGFLLEREVTVLEGVLDQPKRPAMAVVAGAKLETKLGVLRSLLPLVDRLFTGGGISNTFLAASGLGMGTSLVDEGSLTEAGTLLTEYGERISLPTDVRVVRAGDTGRPLILPVQRIGPSDEIFDLGPETTTAYCRSIRDARTVVWSGPLGKFEIPAFAEATRAVAVCVPPEAFAVVGGGDTVRAMAEMNLLDRFDHVSTGGGAMLTMLERAPMPGLDPLYVP